MRCTPNTRRTTAPVLVPALLLSLGSAGCGKSDSKGSASKSRSASGYKTAKPSELVEYDLGPAGDAWKGWVAKGPTSPAPRKKCQVMQDLEGAARVACDGPGLNLSDDPQPNGFDVRFLPVKKDLAQLKERMKKRWSSAKARGELKVLVDRPELLAWREGKGKIVAYHFVMPLKVGGRDVTCESNLMVGAGIEAEHQLQLAACKTLAKK